MTIKGIGFGVLMYVVQGCRLGFFGFNCTEPCRYPGFGERCQRACNCTRDLCDHITGCPRIEGCQVGYFGYNCTKRCRYPGFGDRCQRACNCTRDECDHITGCPSTEACDDGYYGQDCILPCKYPSFGKKCQHTCNCIPFECNNINGCENTTEITEMLTTKSEEVLISKWTFIDKHQEVIITGGCSLLLILAMCVCLKLKKCNHVPSTQPEEKADQPPDLYSYPSVEDTTRASYRSLDELDENYENVDPNLYVNTGFSYSSTI